jgi:hypothetical protein
MMGKVPPPFTVSATAFDTSKPGFVTVISSHPADAISAGLITAANCVALTNVVARALPLKSTVAPLTNSVPFTSTFNGELIVSLDGESDVIAGIGPPIDEKVAAVDVPPPGLGLLTVTICSPVAAMSVARIAAVTCVPLTNVVVRGEELKFTTEVGTKPVPFTVSVNAAPPAIAFDGEMVAIAGTG